MRSRRGSSLLEVILSLGIIALLLVGVSRYIWLFSGMEVRNKDKTKWKETAESFYEEIRNLDQTGFVEMMAEMRDSEEIEILSNGFTQVKELSVKSLFQEEGEGINTFFVSKMKDDNVYVKVSFKNTDFNKESFGVGKRYAIDGTEVERKFQWKNEEACDIVIEATKNSGNISYGFKVTAGGFINNFNGFSSEDYTGEIGLGDGWLKFNAKNFQPVKVYVGDDGGDIFIGSEIEHVKRFTIRNNSERYLAIYVDGINMELNTIGDNILIYSNDSQENPNGSPNKVQKVAEFDIKVYSLLESGMVERFHINGFKKIERFSI